MTAATRWRLSPNGDLHAIDWALIIGFWILAAPVAVVLAPVAVVLLVVFLLIKALADAGSSLVNRP